MLPVVNNYLNAREAHKKFVVFSFIMKYAYAHDHFALLWLVLIGLESFCTNFTNTIHDMSTNPRLPA